MANSGWFSLHSHSRFSANDAMPGVSAMVDRAVFLGYPALGLTDHGTVAGAVQLYKACRKAGIEPLPGEEFYITPDREHRQQSNYHITIAAYSEVGYRNLVKLHNLAQTNFFYKPRIDLADLSMLSTRGGLDGLVASSGCYFGLVVQTLVTQGPTAAKRLLCALAAWFPRFYVELHNHEVVHYSEPDYKRLLRPILAADADYQALKVEHDRVRQEIADRIKEGKDKNKGREGLLASLQGRLRKAEAGHKAAAKEDHVPERLYDDAEIVRQMVTMADELGIPYIIAQDSHYIDAADQPLHDGLKSLVSFSDDPSEAIFPGGPYSMFGYEDLVPLYDAQVLSTSVDNLADLAARAHVRLPELETFRLRVPDVTVTGDAYAELVDRCQKAWNTRKDFSPNRAHEMRLDSELETIHKSGFADYLLLTAKVCDFMRLKDIWYHVRGSASGSLVVWLLGISQLEPVSWDLRMDRFMSTDRMKPPDIDLDVERDRREEVVAFMAVKWTVRQIGSHMKYTVTDDKDSDEEDSSKGSLVVKYFSAARKSGVHIKEWGQIGTEDQDLLKALGSLELLAGPGTHAAGYLISPDEQAAKQVPMTWMTRRKAMVTTFGMKDVEALGFVKLDLLGSRTLTAIKNTMGYLGWSQTQYESIDLKDKATYARIQRGDTTGIFQFDGFAMMRGSKDLKPRNIEDIIAAQALYRPATMHSGATKDFLARRNKDQPVPVRHADIQAETSKTFGVLLYQEQVIGVMRRLGMDPMELQSILSAVKASNEHSAGAAVVLEQTKPLIRGLGEARGWTDVDIDWLLDALVAYGEYSFNRAHAASYGVVAYRTAYLAEHHPVEFWLGLICANEATDREAKYLSAARGHGVRVLPANVNDSSMTYSMDGKHIRKGLIAIKNVGRSIAAEVEKHRPYADFKDFANKVNPIVVTGTYDLASGIPAKDCRGAVGHLYEGNAFECFE